MTGEKAGPPGPAYSDIDVRARILAVLGLIGAVVMTGPMGPAEFALTLVFVATLIVLAEVSPVRVFGRALLVLPFAGTIALFAPLARLPAWSWETLTAAYALGWPQILAILTKTYVSALLVTALVASTPLPELLRGLQALKLPQVFLSLFTFLLRYAELFREQLAAMRDAIASRAPGLRGWRLLMLYGSLGGALFVRAYERGEQIYDAMLARGYTGTLPAANPLIWRRRDSRFLALVLAFAAVLVYYP